MGENRDPLEQFWDNILSEDPEKIRAAYATIDQQTKAAVLAHLQRMASEPDWHPAQRASALAALKTLLPL